jgi:hypothetical protein
MRLYALSDSYDHTVAEKVNVHIVQKRQTITCWTRSWSSTLCKMFLDARTVAKNDGAYWLLIGSSGSSMRAWTKKLR